MHLTVRRGVQKGLLTAFAYQCGSYLAPHTFAHTHPGCMNGTRLALFDICRNKLVHRNGRSMTLVETMVVGSFACKRPLSHAIAASSVGVFAGFIASPFMMVVLPDVSI